MSAERDKPLSLAPVSGEVPINRDVLAKLDEVLAAQQGLAESQYELCGAVEALDAKVGALRNAVHARIPPGYRWASLCCLVLIAISLLRIAFAEPRPMQTDHAVHAARLGGGA